MKILMVHNAYQQRGGEEAVVDAESRVLAENGHSVVFYKRDNSDLRRRGPMAALSTAVGTIWSADSYRDIAALLTRENPEVAHFHNTLPLVSPSGYYACHAAKVPVVQTLHNYRLLCPAGTFLRNERVCELCLGRRIAWPSALHACYRNSRSSSAAVAGMLGVHHALGTWKTKVDLYIALTEFARTKFVQGGLDPNRVVVKSNFVCNDPGPKSTHGEYALFAGRHTEAKGVRVLIDAWGALSLPIPLRIAGDGPLCAEIQQKILDRKLTHVSLLGLLSSQETQRQIKDARFLVVPSSWFEGFPMIIAEAFACGVPVLCSRLGSMEEIVDDQKTGLHFDPGNAEDLARKTEWLWTHDADVAEMGRNARREFEAKYSAKHALVKQIEVYEQAINTYQDNAKRSAK